MIAFLLYPQTLIFLSDNGKDFYVAMKINLSSVQSKEPVQANKTKIVFMFDDGWRSVYTKAYSIMKEYNYKGSVPIIPSLVGEKEYMDYGELGELYLQGWDLLNHSYSHSENMYEDCDALFSDYNKARQWMKNRYIGDCGNMAVIPYGEINPYLIRQLKDKGYDNVRTSDNIIILDNDNIIYYPIITINLLTDMPVDKVKDILIQTFNEPKTVLVILHKIGEKENGFGMTYSKEKFENIIVFIGNHQDKLQVITYSQLF